MEKELCLTRICLDSALELGYNLPLAFQVAVLALLILAARMKNATVVFCSTGIPRFQSRRCAVFVGAVLTERPCHGDHSHVSRRLHTRASQPGTHHRRGCYFD